MLEKILKTNSKWIKDKMSDFDRFLSEKYKGVVCRGFSFVAIGGKRGWVYKMHTFDRSKLIFDLLIFIPWSI